MGRVGGTYLLGDTLASRIEFRRRLMRPLVDESLCPLNNRVLEGHSDTLFSKFGT